MRILPMLALAASGLVSAQTPQAVIAGDSRTAVVRGKITNAKTGAPLKDVQLKMGLVGHGLVAGAASSDANGNYEIRAGIPDMSFTSVIRKELESSATIEHVPIEPSLSMASQRIQREGTRTND